MPDGRVCTSLRAAECSPGPGAAWVFVCPLVSLCGCEVEGALLLCPLPARFCGPPPFAALRIIGGPGGSGPTGGASPSERPVCAAALSTASASTLPFIPESCQEFRSALGDPGSRARVGEMGPWGDWWGLLGSGSAAHPGSGSRAPDPQHPGAQRVGALQRPDGRRPRPPTPHPPAPSILSPFLSPWVFPSSGRLQAGREVT